MKKKGNKADSGQNSSNQGSDLIPEQLKIYVSQDVWNMWSPIRRESFTQILKNPNTFFYRNRPPGDPQKTGPFTPEEEEQFLDRLHYFREVLGVEDGLWGLFAVPIRGRLGYQCANFYRNLIMQGKIHDDHYQIVDGKLNFLHGSKKTVSESTMKILTQEAFNFIETCLKSEDGEEAPKMLKPVRVAPPPKEVKKKSTHNSEVIPDKGSARDVPSFLQFRRTRALLSEKENTSPICGAIDPMSNQPIKVPMMDEDGYVMDLSSWRLFLKGKSEAPFPTTLQNEFGLIEITSSNYSKFKHLIVNIPC